MKDQDIHNAAVQIMEGKAPVMEAEGDLPNPREEMRANVGLSMSEFEGGAIHLPGELKVIVAEAKALVKLTAGPKAVSTKKFAEMIAEAQTQMATAVGSFNRAMSYFRAKV